ncbi:MAG: NUDIX hydrolase [Candidatus Omnitrophica bacterium]|nr:NUDIX hydrolase [Candidatus Omnitrophota bacterium]
MGYLDYIVNKLKSPFLTVDAIIEVTGGIVLIERSNPPFGFALPGGFVDYGESLEDAVIREAKEETNLDIRDVRQFHTYSAPGNDPRFHTVSTVFISRADGLPKAGDDAAEAHVVSAGKIEHLSFAFHHKKIIQDYLIFKAGDDPFKSV